MSVSIIVAMTKDFVIGRGGRLPWHLPQDLSRFKRITMGKPVIMGRKTFESMKRPLPGRNNIVLSRNKNFRSEGIAVVDGFHKALEMNSYNTESIVIGGSQVFQKALPFADKIYLTLIQQSFSGDTYFPEIDFRKEFRIVEESGCLWTENGEFSYSFIHGQRCQPILAGHI